MQRRIAIPTLIALILIAPLTLAYDRDDDDDDSGGAFVIASGQGESFFGERAYMGVQLEEETEWEEGGARITRVVDDSPADDAGLRKGDIIVRFNGRTIRGPVGLTKAIHETGPGDAVELTVVRDGREQALDLEMGERNAFRVLTPQWNQEFNDRMGTLGRTLGYAYSCEGGDCTVIAPDCEGDECPPAPDVRFFGQLSRPTLGVQLVEVTPELREHLGGREGQGVLVSKVLDGTPAEDSGVQVGDLIVEVSGDAIGSTTDLRRALRDKRGETFDVEVIRNSRQVTIEVTIPEPERDIPSGPRAWVSPDLHFGHVHGEAIDHARAAQGFSVRVQRSHRPAHGRLLDDSI